ncbi:AAA family ATPase [Olleya marilimosa]|uniref:ATP-binding protein n=1 Tax=Olleya marilimosa TaxID=272164 RepID=A0ABR8LTV3_9FLAO|nr:AAA family ATPase [Olleya marilimosa]MBD3863260.1 ATP-binding protein [Olleya marilimosa]
MENLKPNQIRLYTKGFRAINSADIIIDGITVVAGENGCGKSTLSKLLYYSYKTMSNYEVLVAEGLSSSLSNVERFIDIALRNLSNKSVKRNNRLELYQDFLTLKNEVNSGDINEELLEEWINLIEKIKLANVLSSNNYNDSKRLSYIALDVVGNRFKDEDLIEEPFELIKKYVDSLFKKAFGLIKSRTSNLFKEGLKEIFHDDKIPASFKVYEFGEEIVSLSKNSLSIPYVIQQVIYIDTPMMVGVDTFEDNHWEDLNFLLRKKSGNSFTEFSNLIAEEIIKGDASHDDSILGLNDFLFKRADGELFNLLDCATGVKSFSILQILLNNGSINDKTLLILDEPETHLHPQWIIEYARLIVLLNKHVGVKFFIASHNPDMVSAIRIISEKENTLDGLNFYIGNKKNLGDYSYDYINLGVNIDPIFDSFNIALDRIHLYGEENNGL